MSSFKRILCAVAVVALPPVSLSASIPHGWTLHRRADSGLYVPLKFALAQSNVHNLNAYLLDIADPRSPNYGKHWTSDQVAKTFRPSQDAVDTVHSWLLTEHGLDPHQIEFAATGGAIRLNVTVAEAERILGAEYNVYQHDSTGKEQIGCHEGYALPEHVAKHVDYVWPTTHFASTEPVIGMTKRGKRAAKVPYAGHEGVEKIPVPASKLEEPSGCDEDVTIDCLKALYNYDYEFVSGNANSYAVFEIQEEGYTTSDLDMFFTKYAPDQVGNQPVLVSIDGGNLDDPEDLSEATLDIELMMGLGTPNLTLQLYQIGGNDSSDYLDMFLAALDKDFCDLEAVSQLGFSDCGDKSKFNVVSMSYHFDPDYQDPTITPYIERQCTEFGKLSLTGMTFVASSGDGGVGYSQAEACLVNGTLTALAGANSTFIGQFPASCPYVTAVGATQVKSGNSVEDPESASIYFPSGAGFSNTFAMPSFQKDAVENYLDNYAPAYGADIFNRSGRAYPDVAANGWPIIVAEYGSFYQSGGTSASAPIFATFVAAINDARLAANKTTIGWINPALYSSNFDDAFNDVTEGTNPACGTDGFPAAPGWDPITGRGTPNFPNMLAAFLALP